MIKRIVLVAALGFISLPLCAKSLNQNPSSHQSAPSAQTTTLSDFKNIDAKGYFRVVLVTDPSLKTSQVIGKGYSKAPISAQVKGHTLILRGAPLSHLFLRKKPVVTVRMKDVERIMLAGSTDLSGKDVYSSKGLHLFSTGSGRVSFTGEPVLMNYLRQNGNGNMTIEWVKGDLFRMDVSGGKVHLAGLIDQAYARVRGYANLDAAYLRVNTLSVQTSGHATARVTAIADLRAFASDQSKVFYYKYPKHLTRGTSESGNVLQMAWHN